MKHLRPLSRAAAHAALSKASMTWYDATILDYVRTALSLLLAIAPALNSIVGSKEDSTDEER
jgi:hypothetical protein